MKFICVCVFIFFWFGEYAQTELWGVTTHGGTNNAGTIFKTDGSGNNQTIEHSFIRTEPESPWYTSLIELPSGKFYGMTSNGGTNGRGVLFEYDRVSNAKITRVNFSDSTFGSSPFGSLLLANDGNLYGMTRIGGTSGKGTVFCYNPQTNICTKEIDFNGSSNGATPLSSFIQATDGNLYGVASEGGTYNLGVLFKYDIQNDQYTKLIDFDATNTGQAPVASLKQYSLNGLIYGTTNFGGLNSVGVIFEYNITTNQFTKKIDFDVSTGSHSVGSLLEGSDGNFYGLNDYGGANNFGVLYQYNPISNIYTNKIDFAGSINGSSLKGNLTLATDGKLYGMTASGGTSGNGTLFQYNYSTNTLINKINLSTATGFSPFGSLVQGSNGKMYGLTFSGGSFEVGTIIEFDIVTNVCVKKLDFGGINDGIGSGNTVVYATDGNFYGIAGGGINRHGVLFKYNPILHTYTNVFNFNTTSGLYSGAALLQASDGNLYGTTSAGGINDMGTLFRYNIVTGVFTKILDFNGVNGNSAAGNQLLESHGKLYGMTQIGGVNNVGVIFMYDIITNAYTTLYDFDLVTGGLPKGSLTEAVDGNFYGMAEIGGMGGTSGGVLFQFNPNTNIYTVKFNFLNGSGTYPKGSLVQASDGTLYGMTYSGGLHNFGTIIQYNPSTNILSKRFDFTGVASGKWPNGSLMQASDGNLYGLTTNGGVCDFGVMFQYNPSTSVFTKKIDFISSNGDGPYYGNLIEVRDFITSISESKELIDFLIYPNPNNGLFEIDLKWPCRMQIFNTLGETVIDKKIEAGVNVIAIPEAKSGFYFLKIENAKGEMTTKKIIISN